MLCMDMNRADWSYNKMIMANKMLEILDQEPIIEERKHGYWIEHPEHPVGDCSICGERVPIYSGSKKYTNTALTAGQLWTVKKNDRLQKINSSLTDHSRRMSKI